MASADLIKKGYEVFRALSPSCSCDLIAKKGSKILRIEVRTGQIYANTGRLSYPKKKIDEQNKDHYAIVINDQVLYEPPLVEGETQCQL